MADCCTLQPSHPTLLDDEITALSLQLEEIGIYSQSKKGKYAVNKAPDIELAYASFQAELGNYKTFIADQQLARSIGAAVNSDGVIIAQLTSEEIQSHEDRLVALQISNKDAEIQSPPGRVAEETGKTVLDWISTATESQYAGSIVDFSDTETDAGPSVSYAARQEAALKNLSKHFKCAVCHENFHSRLIVSLPCNDRYCIDCLKGLFIRATKDDSLLPVRCHQQPILLQLVSKHLSADELAAFELASLEFHTVDRVYCSNRDCGRFIPPGRVEQGTHRAVCERCNTLTCAICKNGYHHGMDCPDDPALRETRALAGEEGWQTCYRCKSIVMIKSGCNHMTCRCKAEFCYQCGTAWKNCNCEYANEARMLERAEEIVDRDAVVVLQPIERQRRVRQVHHELEQNHECGHPGKFQRIFHGGRRGFRCEMCDTRHWKYILQCRHCHINVCEDCRRNRV
ncbi:hypothetical protein BCR34DRAFT_486219 [Clohesyomyces aquaticus]|uniref:RBR-type E3 ubiquitin transferase n=1 Tax=Clohesyomyces aquaticus TaxID=1231657 RepID=A0A1Y1ZIL4_9PLEO|nr:hypothetical protein BCR34DRAFT_486219 [Clohesyomyces aquaticus]